MDFENFATDFDVANGKWAFGITGSGPSLRLIDTLEQHGVKFITTGHESTAALMAGAYGRLTGNPAIAISIKGPGFMNLLPGLLSNAYEGYPSLSVSESYPSDHTGPRNHKWLDQRRAGQEFLKQHRYFASDAGYLNSCWAQAQHEFPGPVHIDLTAGSEHRDPPHNVHAAPLSSALMGALERSARPLLIVGSLGLRAGWGGSLKKLGIPIFTTPAAKGLVDETDPFAAGVFTGAGKPATAEKTLLGETDLLITLGVRSGELLNPTFDTTRSVHIDNIIISSDTLFPARSLNAPTEVLNNADIATVIERLMEKSWGLELLAECHSRLDDAVSGYGWNPAHAMRLIQAALPSATHILDTGNFTVLAEHFLKARTTTSVIGTPNGRYMGAGLGYALGASIALPDNPIVLWVGDGGLRMSIGELALAAEQGCKLLVVVIKDGYFGSIRGNAMVNELTQAPVTLSERSPLAIAQSMGIDGRVVTNGSDLAQGLDEWRRDLKPSLFECVVDADEYIEQAGRLR